MDVEVTGLRKLVQSLEHAGLKGVAAAEAAVLKGSMNIKKDASARVSGLSHAPAYPASISFDMHTTVGAINSEIGPDKGRRQGALGNLLEFGSVNNAPRPHLVPALEAEAPRFERVIADAAGKLLDG